MTEELDSHEYDGEYEEEEDDGDGDSQQEHCSSVEKCHCVARESYRTTGTRASYLEITGSNQNQPLCFIERTENSCNSNNITEQGEITKSRTTKSPHQFNYLLQSTASACIFPLSCSSLVLNLVSSTICTSLHIVIILPFIFSEQPINILRHC